MKKIFFGRIRKALGSIARMTTCNLKEFERLRERRGRNMKQTAVIQVFREHLAGVPSYNIVAVELSRGLPELRNSIINKE